MRNVILAMVLGCIVNGAVAAPNCDAATAREYTLRANDAGATCYSFVNRFGPSFWNTPECREVNYYVNHATAEYAKLTTRGCVEMVDGPTRGELAYTRWLSSEFRRLASMRWDEQRGWVTK